MIDAERITAVLSGLVSIESVNPSLVPGGGGEERMAKYVYAFLAAAGFDARLERIGEGRFNATGLLKGLRSGPRLMLNGHLDTVGVSGMERPFLPRVENGRLYGRGALDMKGGIAAALVAAEHLAKQRDFAGEVLIALVADEEMESRGTREMLKQTRADMAIVLEPTWLEVATAHKGFAWAEIETRGRAAHGSRADEGRDAIAFMGRVLHQIEALQFELSQRPAHPLLRHGSVHASLISGGQELSSYPETCKLSIERRLLPGEDATTLEAEVIAIIVQLTAHDPAFHAGYKMGYSARALETPLQTCLAQHLLECTRTAIGSRARFGTQPFWTDAALLQEAGIPAVLFGPGGAGMHSAVEYVNLEDVRICSEVLIDFIAGMAG
ncbi:MAG TPA: M20/M25/M40 family metallo-hydrolase [Terriglobia bacterium]|nr:M20/M25/M40 family metallo-hydrolase [Terriglobia bacterium]